MADPRSIRVKKVEAADPELIVTLESESAGDSFPCYVQLTATVTYRGQSFPASGENSAVTPASTEVIVNASFNDSGYGPNETLGYTINTIRFSNDNRIWTAYNGQILDRSGTVNTGTGS